MDRYKIIKTGENILRMNTCPIYSEKYHILLDTKTNTNVLQIKFKNIDSKNIKSIFLDIDCYDDSKDFLCTLNNVAYVGLDIKKRQTFGDKQAINTNKNIVGNISIKVLKVVFTDESVWRNESCKYLEEMPTPVDAKKYFGELYNQYVRECEKLHINFRYVYTVYNDFWQCSCGKPNDKDREVCFNCDREKEVIEKVSNIYYLKEENIKFEELKKQKLIAEQEKEKQRLFAEEQERAKKKLVEEKNKKQKLIKRKQRNKNILKIGCILFAFLGVCFGSSFIYKTFQYDKAIKYMENGENAEAINIFYKIGDFKNLQNSVFNISTISDTMAVKNNGTIISNDDDIIEDTYDWHNIVGISSNYNHTVGLKNNGTVVAVGGNFFGKCEVDDWKDIVAISAGNNHTVGLKKDGTVVAVGDNSDGQCEVNGWKDIIAISTGNNHTVGLKKDGTIVAAGDNSNGQCDVSKWKNIASIYAGSEHTIGLKSDGTLVVVGEDYRDFHNVSEWRDIVSVYTIDNRIIGLKSNGTLVFDVNKDYDICEVDCWKDVKVYK